MNTDTRRATKPAAPNWQHALCSQTDSDLFFPEGRGGQIYYAVGKAKEICGRCPIRPACLDWALEMGEVWGVWGGLDEKERRALLRERMEYASAYDRCIAEQEYIEQRVAEGASQREIAGELGVGHSVVGRAVRFFQAERQAAAEVVRAA